MQIAEDFRSLFQTCKFKLTVFGDDEYIAARWTMTRTHTSQWNDIQATNKKVSFSCQSFRFENGKVVEESSDDLGLIQQLSKVYTGK
jgi:predicted ester cyclase